MIDINQYIVNLSQRIRESGENERHSNRCDLYACILLIRYGFVTKDRVTNATLMNYIPEQYRYDDKGDLISLSHEGVRLIIENYTKVLVCNFNYLFCIDNEQKKSLLNLLSLLEVQQVISVKALLKRIEGLKIFPNGLSSDFIPLLKLLINSPPDHYYMVVYPLRKTSDVIGRFNRGLRNSRESIELIFYKKDTKKIAHLKKIIGLTETAIKNSTVVNLELLAENLSVKLNSIIDVELLFNILSSRSDFLNITEKLKLNESKRGLFFTLTDVENQYFFRDLTTLLYYRESIGIEDMLLDFTKNWFKFENKKISSLFGELFTSGFDKNKGLRDYGSFDSDVYCLLCVSAIIYVVTHDKRFKVIEQNINDNISLSSIMISSQNNLKPIINDNYNVFFKLPIGLSNYNDVTKALLKSKKTKFENSIATNLFYGLSEDGTYLYVTEDNVDFYTRSLGNYILPDYDIKLKEDMDIAMRIAKIKQQQRYVFENFWFTPNESLPINERYDLLTIQKNLNITSKHEFFKNKQCVDDLISTIKLIPLAEARAFLSQDLRICKNMVENRLLKIKNIDESLLKKDDQMLYHNRRIINEEIVEIEARQAVCTQLIIDIEVSNEALEINRLTAEREAISLYINGELSTAGKFREERFIHCWIVENGGELDLIKLKTYITEQLEIDSKSVQSFTCAFLNKNPLSILPA